MLYFQTFAMRIQQPASGLKNNPPNINNLNLSIYCKSFEKSADGSDFIFLRWFKLAHICRPIQVTPCHTKETSKRISQANYFYRTSISRTTTHPHYWNLIHFKSII